MFFRLWECHCLAVSVSVTHTNTQSHLQVACVRLSCGQFLGEGGVPFPFQKTETHTDTHTGLFTLSSADTCVFWEYWPQHLSTCINAFMNGASRKTDHTHLKYHRVLCKRGLCVRGKSDSQKVHLYLLLRLAPQERVLTALPSIITLSYSANHESACSVWMMCCYEVFNRA